VPPWLSPLRQLVETVATCDVLLTLSRLAHEQSWCRPLLSESPQCHIVAGRHSLVETHLEAPFIPNDLTLDETTSMVLITGPNMGGKSTYMRQTALIVLMAHLGSFVPAKAATLGPFDRIFSRIGASDDLSSGRSTFMVEMTETAHILQEATPHSLILMDEVGRGTSTYDGLAIAWAVASHLAEHINGFTLFATHYFELTALPQQFSTVKNFHVTAKEVSTGIVFLYEVHPGPASQSYGIQVAKLAGLPESVIHNAKQQLTHWEQRQGEATPHPVPTNSSSQGSDDSDPLAQVLHALNIEELTPKAALDLLYEWKTHYKKR